MTSEFEGLALVQDVHDLSEAINSGSWVDGSLAGLSTGLDVLGTIGNPADALLSSGVAWLIEHVDVLTQALNMFAGEPAAIEAYATQWRDQASDIDDIRVQLRNHVSTDTTAWSGTAGDAYRLHASQRDEGLLTLSSLSNTVADAVHTSGQVVAAGRVLTRDLIAQCVSEVLLHLPVWLAVAGCSLGLGTPAVIADAVYLIAKWV